MSVLLSRIWNRAQRDQFAPAGRPVSEIVSMSRAGRKVMETTDRAGISRAACELSLVCACVQILAESASQAPLRAYKGDPDGERVRLSPRDPGIDGLVARLSARPVSDAQAGITASGMTARRWFDRGIQGEAFSWLHRSSAGLWVETRALRPDRMRYEPDEFGRIRWWYHSESNARETRIDPRDIIHWKRYDPRDDFRGLSPLAILDAEGVLGLSASALDYLFAYFRNGGIPAFMISFDSVDMKPSDLELVEERIRAKTGRRYGLDNTGWREPLAMYGGAKIQSVGAGPEHVDLKGMLFPSEARVCSLYRVPAIIAGAHVGLEMSAAYGLPAEALSFMWLHGVIPGLMADAEQWTLHLRQEFGRDYFAEHDWSRVDALQPRRTEERNDLIRGYLAGVVPRSAAMRAFGLIPGPDDDVLNPAPQSGTGQGPTQSLPAAGGQVA